ncbi:MAG: diaminopimelate decarboxylase [Bacteroidota bacterium]
MDRISECLKAAQTYGTPLYCYDGNKIIEQYHTLKNAFNVNNISIYYALKALNNINILKLLKKEGAGLDAVSIEEVMIGLKAGFSPDKIMFTPNCVDFEEMQKGVELGVRINIDNIPTLEKFGACYGDKVKCCIRFNPHIFAGGNSNISVGHIDSKFGISIYQIKHVERVVKNYNLIINGLHMHTGSDIIDGDVFLRGADILFDAANSFKNLEFIDFGSGFKVGYKKDDIVTDIHSIGKKISRRFNEFCTKYGRNIELAFEPGKFIVSEAGKLLVKANLIKQTTSTVFVGVNSGQNHLIRPMFYQAYHQIDNISNPEGEKRLYSVVGYICESDTFGYDRLLNEVREGDILSISNAGAYGYSMSNNYNARLKPAEVLFINDEIHLIRKREILEDLSRNEIELTI